MTNIPGRTAPGFLGIIERFVKQESFSGFLLFAAALVAMLWANSPWSQSYFDLWHTPVGLEVGTLILDMDLGHWVNDALMAIFFLVIGLEIKRELMVGELSSMRKAAFPLVAALGGMVVPVLFYIAVNLGEGGQVSGFGIPMATDIAFALGFLLLLGKRVPMSLKIFLISLAIFDDLGAIAVIALFYGSSLDLAAIGYAAAAMGALILLNRTGVKNLIPYLILGVVLWFSVSASGIHPTVAGVLLALTIPVRSKISGEKFINVCQLELEAFSEHEADRKNMLLTDNQQDALESLADAYDAVQNPLVRLQHRLHPISAFFIMPLFALANAGVLISGISFSVLEPISLGILLGLVLGKPIGIAGFAYIATRLGWTQKPTSIAWKHVIGAGMLGGVGFTMSIFIANIAFENEATIALGKLFILSSSMVMGVLGVLYLSRIAAVSSKKD
jgi:NhaA family Na+:H+ antiporter